jgi:hypothetical protein
MARAAVAQRHLLSFENFALIGLPRLSEEAHQVYETVLPQPPRAISAAVGTPRRVLLHAPAGIRLREAAVRVVPRAST